MKSNGKVSFFIMHQQHVKAAPNLYELLDPGHV